MGETKHRNGPNDARSLPAHTIITVAETERAREPVSDARFQFQIIAVFLRNGK